MIRAFWQGKIPAALIILTTAAISVLLWISTPDSMLAVRLTLVILIMGIGLFAGVQVGTFIANGRNMKLLRILHMELDPETFLAAYAPIPGRIRKGSRWHALACTYLAAGHSAAGEHQKAIDILRQAIPAPDKCDLELQGVYYNDLCAYAVAAGDMKLAHEAESGVEAVLVRAWQKNSGMAKNLKQNLTLERCRMALAEGGAVDTAWLEDQLPKAQFRITRLKMAQALAEEALRRDDKSTARHYIAMISKSGGKTYLRDWAEKMKNEVKK